MEQVEALIDYAGFDSLNTYIVMITKPQIKVVSDFRGQQYVCETSHHGNVTVKRNYSVMS